LVPVVLECQVAGDSEQKHFESAALRVVPLGVPDQRQETLLGNVFRDRGASGQPVGKAVYTWWYWSNAVSAVISGPIYYYRQEVAQDTGSGKPYLERQLTDGP
jgi:hypothetical protein